MTTVQDLGALTVRAAAGRVAVLEFTFANFWAFSRVEDRLSGHP